MVKTSLPIAVKPTLLSHLNSLRSFLAPSSALPLRSRESTSSFATQVDNEYAEHAKRLKTYTKSTLLITFSLLVAFYSTSLDKQEKKIFILASFASLLSALLFEIILLVLSECLETPSWNCFPCRYGEQMYFFIYGSSLLLMLTALFLLLLCTSRYKFLSVFLVLALPVIASLFYQAKMIHTESIKKYKEHDSELNCISELSAAIVIMLFAGPSFIVFSSPTLPRQNLEMKTTECFLYITIIMGLLLMLLTSVMLQVYSKLSLRQNIYMLFLYSSVKFLKVGNYSLVALVGLLAASEILQGLVVFSTSMHIAGAMYWFVRELICKLPDQVIAGPEQVPKMEIDPLSMVLASSSFSVLMYVYSTNVDNSKLHSPSAYFLLMAVCMLSLCSTFISSLGKMIIFRYYLQTRPWKNAKVVMNFITYPVVFVAALSSFLLAVYKHYAM
ncbi:hypothetical protein LUZ61_012074 [Rhynchospora tenuis]|uniref:Uncharacterized protein n=1 Tax=Rhynchospora tenuis TaxID=198213 RepID=A0AAD6F0Y2_9POAL|nr:hypothetical protein LUZ61_012074 [Rhynchospora tenuis]